MGRFVPVGALLIVVLTAGCAEPPNKEMNQAQGALDAARAAGAGRFAADELTAAADALKRSEDAVAAGDYRQALSHAIDSRERAQNAAKMAVEGRANARGQAERSIAEVATLLERADAELAAADAMRLPRRALREPLAVAASARKALQEARSALEKEEYEGVSKALGRSSANLQAALAQLDRAAAPPSKKR